MTESTINGTVVEDPVGATSRWTAAARRGDGRGRAAVGAPWRFGSDEPEDLLRAGGWSVRRVVQPDGPGADGKDLPYPVVPRDADVPGPPRVLFTVGCAPDPAPLRT